MVKTKWQLSAFHVNEIFAFNELRFYMVLFIENFSEISQTLEM